MGKLTQDSVKEQRVIVTIDSSTVHT